MAAGKAEVVDALKEIAFGIELDGGNGFQVRAFQNAAQSIKRVESDIRELYASGQLAQIYGFTDLDGSRPDAWRYVTEVQDAGKPADTTGYR